jgi:RNA polymerase sigma factor (sigma-70 family)
VTVEHTEIKEAKQNLEKVAEIFKAHGDFLLSVFQKKLKEQDARDLWQNLFLSLLSRPVPADIANVRGYLYRAAIRDIIDFKRGLKLNQQKMDEYSHMTSQTTDRSLIHNLVVHETIIEAFMHIESSLPPAVRRAMLHKHTRHMSHREIAEHMNIKKETVDRYLSVGTKMMEQIQDQITGEDNGQT